MRLGDLFRDTVSTMLAHKLRTALTMFGIAWGIVSIMLMVAAGEGLRVGQAKVAANFGKDIMIVFAGRTSLQAGGTRAGRLVWWETPDVAQVQQLSPDCRYVMPELGNEVKVHSDFNAASPTVTGAYPPFAEIRSIDVGEGRFYDWADENEGRRVAVLGTEIKKQLFGEREAVGEHVYLNEIPYVVVGVMKKKDQDSSYDGFDVNKIFVPFSVMQTDFPNKPPRTQQSVDRLLVTPLSVNQHEACKHEVVGALAKIHGFDPHDKEAAGVWDTIEEAKAFQTMTDGMKYFLGAVGLVTLLLGGIGVMNVMLVAVRERTREIGVRKAVGATSATILRQFLIESMIIAGVSGALGFTVALSICALVDMAPMPPFFAGLLPTWQSGALAFALLGTIAVLSALYPARRAASVDPIVALRYEAGG